jgi:hypothetical protein
LHLHCTISPFSSWFLDSSSTSIAHPSLPIQLDQGSKAISQVEIIRDLKQNNSGFRIISELFVPAKVA